MSQCLRALSNAMVALCVLGFAAQANASLVKVETRPGMVAGADYHVGESGRPAVILVHGFLQTREFPTVKRLAESLAEEGYTTLLPTLSLGIANRVASLPCSALQLHGMEGTAKEIRIWMRWLRDLGHERIVLIGHSAGSVSVLSAMESGPPEGLAGMVLISLTYFGQGPHAAEVKESLLQARALAERGSGDPAPFRLAFCNTYLATPKDFLSYAEWGKQRILAALSKLRIPLRLVMGQNDSRMDADWLNALKSTNVGFLEIPGANHFFDQSHEFDLVEAVIEFLRERV